MATPAHHPQTSAERLIARTIEATWALWLIGGLYIIAPVLGWVLAGMVVVALYIRRAELNAIPATIWVWIISMAAMLAILLIGHANLELGIAKTIKSSVGWAKGWALIALFPLAAAVLKVSPEVVYRSVCKLGLYTLLVLPLFLVAPLIGLPEKLWVSPLKILGGAGPEYFTAQLYTLEPGSGRTRWQFFAPWSPAIGMMGVIYVLLAAQEKERFWKVVGIAGGLALAVLSQSRLALVALIVIAPIVWAVSRMDRGYLWFLAAPAVFALGIMGPILLEMIDAAMAEFAAARADSSRVRAILGRIAIERWQTEAYWFGHGIVENGPHLVEYMPIGSHHSWYGLLFVKGITGAIALAIPLALTSIVLIGRSIKFPAARPGFAMMLVLIIYSFGENLEILAYLYWPALIVIGATLSSRDDQAAQA
jgi:hypothetical protein